MNDICNVNIDTNKNDLKKNKLKFAGGSGFLGQHIVKQLQEKDNDVKEIRIIDLQPYKKKLGK